ncbi:MAG: hypothetical protein SO116_09255 [Treponema sp.]|nr:hypothetical protein [Spirochaetia bacterium]MDD7013871.1 hypothetical protein [Spirochaetales bacterium]MDY4903039.1 hypothetical protein [Treponema sp.]
MARSVLEQGKYLLSKRKFSLAIKVLESKPELYEGVFDWYLTLGTACLYVGDFGGAATHFQKARTIQINNTNLLLGQAAIFLRRGDTDRAIQYYLDILDLEPNNPQAKSALSFIREKGDYETICKWVDNGKIERFYPPLGVNPAIVRNCVFAGIFLGLLIAVFTALVPEKIQTVNGKRGNLEQIALSQEEKKMPEASDLSDSTVRYILDSKAINRSFEQAMYCFQNYRDNHALIELNRILNSNARVSIRQKAFVFIDMLNKNPTFNSIDDSDDNVSYAEVIKEPELYIGCFAAWSGRIANIQNFEGGAWQCDLLVGYEDNKSVEGKVTVTFEKPVYPKVEGDKPVRFLGKVDLADGNVVLRGISIYQPLKGTF